MPHVERPLQDSQLHKLRAERDFRRKVEALQPQFDQGTTTTTTLPDIPNFNTLPDGSLAPEPVQRRTPQGVPYVPDITKVPAYLTKRIQVQKTFIPHTIKSDYYVRTAYGRFRWSLRQSEGRYFVHIRDQPGLGKMPVPSCVVGGETGLITYAFAFVAVMEDLARFPNRYGSPPPGDKSPFTYWIRNATVQLMLLCPATAPYIDRSVIQRRKVPANIYPASNTGRMSLTINISSLGFPNGTCVVFNRLVDNFLPRAEIPDYDKTPGLVTMSEAHTRALDDSHHLTPPGGWGEKGKDAVAWLKFAALTLGKIAKPTDAFERWKLNLRLILVNNCAVVTHTQSLAAGFGPYSKIQKSDAKTHTVTPIQLPFAREVNDRLLMAGTVLALESNDLWAGIEFIASEVDYLAPVVGAAPRALAPPPCDHEPSSKQHRCEVCFTPVACAHLPLQDRVFCDLHANSLIPFDSILLPPPKGPITDRLVKALGDSIYDRKSRGSADGIIEVVPRDQIIQHLRGLIAATGGEEELIESATGGARTLADLLQVAEESENPGLMPTLLLKNRFLVDGNRVYLAHRNMFKPSISAVARTRGYFPWLIGEMIAFHTGLYHLFRVPIGVVGSASGGRGGSGGRGSEDSVLKVVLGTLDAVQALLVSANNVHQSTPHALKQLVKVSPAHLLRVQQTTDALELEFADIVRDFATSLSLID